ncbi:MAG: type II toxin-antitoxin system RelE/ParE family toxin [Candidatus Marinimicrobia bacterium]|nr:type II toxin-antitoxin system RelE/ParE family toxin [Candidatus Neomarinimicrobiota bacterium]
MAQKIRWSPRAADNLENIVNYIAQDSEHYASLFAQRIMRIIENIPQFPLSGRVVPEYRDDFLREKIYKNYRIVYRIKKEVIEIVAICHSAMPLKDL